jgi:hypothetical protein
MISSAAESSTAPAIFLALSIAAWTVLLLRVAKGECDENWCVVKHGVDVARVEEIGGRKGQKDQDYGMVQKLARSSIFGVIWVTWGNLTS